MRQPDFQRVRLVTFSFAADVGEPVFSVVRLKRVGAAPNVIHERGGGRALPRVPPFFTEGRDRSERLPMNKVVALRKARDVAGFVEEAQVDHIPRSVESENVRAVDGVAVLLRQDDSVFEGRFDFFVDRVHLVVGYVQRRRKVGGDGLCVVGFTERERGKRKTRKRGADDSCGAESLQKLAAID